MGGINSLLGWLDAKGRSVRNSLKDIWNNPAAADEMWADRIAQTAKEMREDPASMLGAGVIKAKGGNWIGGSVEDALKELKKYTSPEDIALRKGWLDAPHPDLQQAGELRATIPQISAISPEGVRLVEENAVRLENRGNMQRQQWQEELASLEQQAALNDWITRNLGRYVKNEMATPEDPIRALAERGVLHFDPGLQPGAAWIPNRQVLGQSELARNWEGASDQAIRTRTPYKDDFWAITLRDNPWLQKLEPNTPVHSAGNNLVHASEQLGFQHLIDELGNALNPASGLPRNFLLDARSLPRVSVPQAVQRVHDINQWRAAQAAAAQAEAMKGNLTRKVIREYPENNPTGLRWTQLLREGDFKAESDAMGHSVRGYEPSHLGGYDGYGLGGWDAIQNGRAKVYSLQDAKGQPHVTVEVGGPDIRLHENSPDYFAKVVGGDLLRRYQALGDDTMGQVALNREVIAMPEFQQWLASRPSNITQIKGKSNRAPNAEYLPFVQDFVRNSPLGGKWSDVGDLHNTGMFRVQKGQKWPGFSEEMPEGYYTIEEAEKQAREKGMDEEVLSNWIKRLRSPWPPGME